MPFGSPYFAGVMFGQSAVAAFAFALATDVILITVDAYDRVVMVDAYSRVVVIEGDRSIYVPDVREDL